MSKTMKRWVLGGAGRENLNLIEANIPTPGPGEILVKASAASLNYRDKLLVDLGFGLPTPQTEPVTPLSDLAGTVVAAGADVTRFVAGDRVISTFLPDWIDGNGPGTARDPNDRVLGGPMQGVLAEYVVLHENWAVRAPSKLTDLQASALPCAGLTAWTALVERGKLRAGQTVVVIGTGGVAIFGMQIALMHGAEVIVVSGDDKKLAWAKELGAHHGINRQKEDWVEAVYRLTNDHGADHILETIGGAHLDKSLRAAAVCGRISLIGVIDGFEISGGFGAFARKRLIVEGIQVGHRRSLEDLVCAFDLSGMTPVIDAVYKMEDFAAALDHLERGPFGKVAVEIG
ncbi:zinc-dependent alcohol dehydrogenase family protein [Phyllobacterium meliloti]|uniref:zinc-dependent alcohol dehydrogenase family protein n=1 Tax=Phyllobacterium meliloti TaxID=555317 RepID=UPI000DD6EDD0|nr:NAD(P)-dependent alcohol dehydrogenase [Phyllobacterium sp. T1293]UGX86580.1 NAD(P)-dependent alcohol dehydrogenase [Phyllobacterium sp. T1293]